MGTLWAHTGAIGCIVLMDIGICIATDQEMESQDQNSLPSEVKVLQ